MDRRIEKAEKFRSKYRWPFRTGGYAFAVLLFYLLGHEQSLSVWLLLLALGFVWPQVADAICRRHAGSVAVDRNCFVVDAIVAGIYLVVVGFNPWVSLSLVFMIFISGAAAGGTSLVVKELIALIVVASGLSLATGTTLQADTPITVMILSALSVVLYGCLVAVLASNNAKAANEAMMQVEESGRALSEALATLATSNESLKQLDRQKTYFFQSISHELRTPLTLLLTPLEEELSLQRGNERLQTSWRNACRLLRLVNQLLDVQQLAAGTREVKLKPINVVRFLKVCGDYFESASKAKDIDFKMTVDGSILQLGSHSNSSTFMMGEVDALEKIVFNFLSNALKHAPERGSIELFLETRGDKIRLGVQDDGPGIAPEAQDSLFKLYSDQEGTDQEKHGIGLGLVLVRELTSSLNGDVGIESSPGTGSKFWAEFPKLPTPKPVLDLLVVDDDEAICMMLEMVFQHSEVVSSVQFANSPAEARKILDSYRVKCVLSDGHMPGETGPTFLKFVRESQPDCRRLLITGNADEDILQEAVNLGGVHQVLYKPIDNHKLMATVAAELKESPIVRQSLWNAIEMTPQDWHLATIPTASGVVDEDELRDTDSVGEGALVLVADDLREMRTLLADALRSRGYRVLLAADGKQALSMATQHHPDLVITDWVMPVMTGVELISSMKEHESLNAVPTILLTAKTDEEAKLIDQNVGADAFLGKPFSVHELTSVVRNILELKVRERELAVLSNFLTDSSLKEYVPAAVIDEIMAARSAAKTTSV